LDLPWLFVELNVDTLKKRRTIHKTKDVAIDFHLVPWYGQSNAWTVGGRLKGKNTYPMCELKCSIDLLLVRVVLSSVNTAL
jgi:hypothetical protein